MPGDSVAKAVTLRGRRRVIGSHATARLAGSRKGKNISGAALDKGRMSHNCKRFLCRLVTRLPPLISSNPSTCFLRHPLQSSRRATSAKAEITAPIRPSSPGVNRLILRQRHNRTTRDISQLYRVFKMTIPNRVMCLLRSSECP
jgi:hypothetical protein